MRNVKPIRNHATGFYITDIPYDQVNNIESIDYTSADNRSYYKLILLNVHLQAIAINFLVLLFGF